MSIYVDFRAQKYLHRLTSMESSITCMHFVLPLHLIAGAFNDWCARMDHRFIIISEVAAYLKYMCNMWYLHAVVLSLFFKRQQITLETARMKDLVGTTETKHTVEWWTGGYLEHRHAATQYIETMKLQLSHKLNCAILFSIYQPYRPVRTLRSSTVALHVIPFVRCEFASDAFSVSSPTLWNNLSQDVWLCANQATFKSRLKSHLFSLAFTASSHYMRLRPDTF